VLVCGLSFALAAETIRPRTDEPEGPFRVGGGIVSAVEGPTRPAPLPAASDRFSPATTRSVTAALKISGATMAGSLRGFNLTPDGSTAVYLADQETSGRIELYSTPVDGSATPTKISDGIVFGTGDNGVSAFQITADGSRVVFTADAEAGGGSDDLYAVPVDGSAAPVRLSATDQRPVTAFGVAPVGGSVVYFGRDPASGTVELFTAPDDAAGQARRLSDVGAGNPTGAVVFATIAPDGTRAVFAADGQTDGVFQWYGVALDAATPGTSVQLSDAITTVGLVAIGPDSSHVVYTADENVGGVFELFEVAISGGAAIRLNGPMAGIGVRALRVAPDGSRVAYLADQTTAGVVEVYAATSGTAESGMRISDPMSGTQSADSLNLVPDGMAVLYEADQTTPGTYDLFRTAIDGSAASGTLYGATAPSGAGSFGELGTPVIGMRAVFPVVSSVVDLFSVPFDGSGSASAINDPLPTGQDVINAFLPPSATTLLMYGSGPAGGAAVGRVWVAPIARDLPPVQVNTTASSGAVGVVDYRIDSTQSFAVWAQDPQTAGKVELFSEALDTDSDGVANAVDNCPFDANALQDPVVFGQTVSAVDGSTLSWPNPTAVRWVRGPLAQVGPLVTDRTGTLPDTRAFSDGDVPPAGGGFYYLFAPDCGGRSYQTTLGTEPSRDAAGLP
jgi:Tol biopolymer transport system component